MSRWITLLSILPTLVFVSGPVAAESRFSGTVRAMEGGGLAVVGMGPWTPARPGFVERWIMVTPDTQIEIAERQDENATATDPAVWPGGFTERRLDGRVVRPGDFVTVIMDREGGDRPVATRIIVVPLTAEGSASPAPAPSQSR